MLDLIIDDSELSRPYTRQNALAERHFGPGPHPGTGTGQEVHAGKSNLPPDLLDRRYFHGTDSESEAQSIMRDGRIEPGRHSTKNAMTPVDGRAYATQDAEFALIHALGGAMAGHEVPEKWIEESRYGYIFEIDPRSFDNLQPDEDEIGRAVSKGTYPWLNDLASEKLPPDLLREVEFGEYVSWATAGKILVSDMTQEQKFQMIRDGAHVANEGSMDIVGAWRVDKTESASYPSRQFDDDQESKAERQEAVFDLSEQVDLDGQE